jgi:DNA-binding LacI/PurR family transcriptional regulator
VKPTIEDVARVAGVSRATVSRVMNAAPGATDAVRHRVRAVIAELGYVPDQAARALASRQQPAIDVVATPRAGRGGGQHRWRVRRGGVPARSRPAADRGDHGPDGISCGVNRREGYLRAVGEFGLPDLSDGGGFTREGGFDAARRLLERHPDLDAMFVACDLMGAGAVQAVTATGRRVPQDVSLVGFDDSIAAVCANPPLSTMRMPVEDMAAAVTRLLLDGVVTAGYRQRVPVELVVRQSS